MEEEKNIQLGNNFKEFEIIDKENNYKIFKCKDKYNEDKLYQLKHIYFDKNLIDNNYFEKYFQIQKNDNVLIYE